MMMPLFKLKTNPIMNMKETSAFLNTCEKVLGFLCVVLMICVIQKDIGVWGLDNTAGCIGFALAILVLLLNYFGWWQSFHGRQSVRMMMIYMVVLPPIFYACIGLWRQNWALFVTAVLFLCIHVVHVRGNLRA